MKAPLNLSPDFERRYQIIEILGEGGMGVVYLAQDRELSRRVAIKFLSIEEDDRSQVKERFEQEARVCAAMKHPNIVPLYVFGHENRKPYLVFEYVQGQTLHERIRSKGHLSDAETLEIARGIFSGLDVAHEKGIIHRDLKPGNIILRGDDRTPMILDFGMAKSEMRGDDLRTRKGLILGTPQYMAPELIARGVVAPSIDIYSMGCTLYECLAGRPPFQEKSEYKIVKMHMKDPVPPLTEFNPKVGKDLNDLVNFCLEKEPGDRIKSAKDAMRFIAAIEEGRPPPKPRRTTRRTQGAPLPPITQPIAFVSSLSLLMSVRFLFLLQEWFTTRKFFTRGIPVLALCAGAGAGLFHLYDTHTPMLRNVRIITSSDGSIDICWNTRRSQRGIVSVQTQGDTAIPATLHEEETTGLVHQMRVESLLPGSVYEVGIQSVSGPVQWSSRLKLYRPEDVQVMYQSTSDAEITVNVDPSLKAWIVARPGTKEEKILPEARRENQIVFRVPLDWMDHLQKPYVEVVESEMLTHRLAVPELRGLIARLLDRLKRVEVRKIVRMLVDDPKFDKRMSFVPDREGHELEGATGVGVSMHDPRRPPPVYFKQLVRDHLKNEKLSTDLELFRGIAPAYFSSTKAELGVRSDLYHALLKLHEIDLVPLYQREGWTLGINEILKPVVEFSHQLDPQGAGETQGTLQSEQAFWATRDYSQEQFMLLHDWAYSEESGYRPGLPQGSQAPNLQELFIPQRKYEVSSLAGLAPGRRLLISMDLLQLCPGYHFTISFGSRDGNHLEVLLAHPGTPEWYRAMEGIRPRFGGGLADPVNKPVRRGSRIPRWGRIQARIPAEYVPRAPFGVTVSYEHIPDVPAAKLFDIARTASTRHFRISVE